MKIQVCMNKLILFFCIMVFPTILISNNFQVGVAKVNITPNNSQNLLGYAPRMSEGVLDSIYHRVVVLDDGTHRFILVSTDIASIAPPTYQKAADRIKKTYNILEQDFWWTNTHTHSAPEVGNAGLYKLILSERYENDYDKEYALFVEDMLVKAVGIAINKLESARLGVGWGYSRANVNRRATHLDNTTFAGENVDGPIDRKIGLIRIENQLGEPLVLIANYPIHGTVLSTKDLRISGDVPGVVANYVEEKGGAPLLFINGAEGNVAPRYSVSLSYDWAGNKERFLNHFKKILGDKILEANENIAGTTENVKFSTQQIIVETPLKAEFDIKDWPKDMGDYLRINSLGKGIIKMPINFLFINNDISIWSAPLELFCEISNEIRATSPYPYTFYYGLANGTLGYFPSEAEFKLGGYNYEAKMSPFSNQADRQLIIDVSSTLENAERKGQ